MRVLLGDSDDLRTLYAAPDQPWLRVNMVSTVDGAATGDDGTSRSINNGVDKLVFDLLRDLADAVVVGAGTVRVEGYAVGRKPLVVVSRTGAVPPTQRDAPRGSVLMATVSSAPRLDEARDVLGSDHVLVLGSHRVDLAAAEGRAGPARLPPPALRGRPPPPARPARPGSGRRARRDRRAPGRQWLPPQDHRRPPRRRTPPPGHPRRAGRHPPRPLVHRALKG